MSSKRATIIPCGGCRCWESELAESVSPNSAHHSVVTINVTPITSVVLHKTLPPPATLAYTLGAFLELSLSSWACQNGISESRGRRSSNLPCSQILRDKLSM